jgi:hypothetical protein
MKWFPAPWAYQEQDGSFVVIDATGYTIAHIDFQSDRDNSIGIDADSTREVAAAFVKWIYAQCVDEAVLGGSSVTK